MIEKQKLEFKKLILRYAPGIISGAADNDPSGIATYSIAGARFGYSQNFLMVLATPMLIAVQAMSGRIGAVKGKGLAAVFSEFLPKKLVYAIVISLSFANIFTLAADISGMSNVASLVLPLPDKFLAVIFSLLAWYLVLFKSFKELQKYFLWLVVFFLSYIPAAVLAKPDWFEVLSFTFIPRINFSLPFILSALATMGTTITPFLFFWQAKEEVEFHHSKKFSLSFAKVEGRSLAPGMIFSQIITIFIIVASGSVLYKNGITSIESAADAARALEPFAGPWAVYLFAAGVVGSGLLAIPVLASTTAYAVSEIFGWRDSLWDKIGSAKRFYAVITLTIFVSLSISLLPINPIKMLFYSQVINGVLSPFLIIALLYLCNSKKVMGKETNGFFDNFFGGLSVLVMLGSLFIVLRDLIPFFLK